MRGAACGLGARRWGMRGIMASLTMVSETSGSAGHFLASLRPGRASRVSAPPPAAREEDKARGPGEAPDYDRARPAQEQASRAASRSQALSANTSLSHGQSRFSRRSRSPAASASWMSAAGTRTPSSRPQVPSATCCLRRVTFFAASQPRELPFASSSRSRIDRGHAGLGSRPALAQHHRQMRADRLPHAGAREPAPALGPPPPGRKGRGWRQAAPLTAASHEEDQAVQQPPHVGLRGRPPGPAAAIRGASTAYCSSLSACPAPNSPTKARLSAVHRACLQDGLLPSLNRHHDPSLSTPQTSQTA